MVELETAGPVVLPVMVGTAGHVDHGKTELVRLLTGCDTDMLPEEKKRGMSIDLGFAPFLLEDSRMVGIIDVPGHEDFIRNMIAGAASIDVLLLVIAADDGIKPQTLEHLKIASLLRTPQVMAVITKIDLVTPERQRQVKRNAADLLSKHGFTQAPVLLESNATGEGVSEVRKNIARLVECISRPSAERAFRMNIERVFSVKGYGTVVTGIPLSGKCTVQEELELFPGPYSVICRTIQKYSYPSRYAEAHACSAINLRGGKMPEMERGMTLARQGAYRETTSSLLSVRMVHESQAIRRRQEMRFCCGTAHRVVSCLLAGSQTALGPEEQGFMQIKWSDPMVLAAGDRFILRSLSPSATIAGGIVLSVNADTRRKKMRVETERLEKARVAAEGGDPFLSEILAGSTPFLHRCTMAHLVQSDDHQVIQKATEEKTGMGAISPITADQWFVGSRMAEIEEWMRIPLSEYHTHNKHSLGMPFSQVYEILGLDHNGIEGIKRIFAPSQAYAIRENCLALKEFRIRLTDQQQKGREQITHRVVAAGRNAVAAGTLLLELELSDGDLQVILCALTEEGSITQVQRYLVSTPVVDQCLQELLGLFAEEPTVELNRFREKTGLTRNLAVPMLEYFDRKGITGRQGNHRYLISKI